MYLSNPMVSVIVPVYNAESTLRRCADSILEQSYPDLELILVDDGSKDSSPLICDSYMQKDARVRVIHKPNSGASATRNLGIAEARGHYLQFVDSDDWLTPDATEKLVAAAEAHQADLVIADFYRVSGKLVASKHRVMPVGVMTRGSFRGDAAQPDPGGTACSIWSTCVSPGTLSLCRRRYTTTSA